MKVQLLPGGGAVNLSLQYLTSFTINDELAVDAGALALSLPRQAQLNVRNIIITHSHMDHLAGLPLMVDNIFAELDHTIKVYAIEETVQALQTHIFNNVIWPDFSSFLNNNGVNLQFEIIKPGQRFNVGRLRILPVPVAHTVPTIGLIIEDEGCSTVISSDTSDTEDLWIEARKAPNLRAAFIECSYPNHKAKVAESYGHLSPKMVLQQMRKLNRDIPFYAYHIKPAHMDEVHEELQQQSSTGLCAATADKPYEF